mmetsp:Transcript_65045/g.205507  ORF Transcript_65045/g.205507 Transcript_65045/m.205507 type:complete len:269 (+) Transcript_65045:555-1361(+)
MRWMRRRGLKEQRERERERGAPRRRPARHCGGPSGGPRRDRISQEDLHIIPGLRALHPPRVPSPGLPGAATIPGLRGTGGPPSRLSPRLLHPPTPGQVAQRGDACGRHGRGKLRGAPPAGPREVLGAAGCPPGPVPCRGAPHLPLVRRRPRLGARVARGGGRGRGPGHGSRAPPSAALRGRRRRYGRGGRASHNWRPPAVLQRDQADRLRGRRLGEPGFRAAQGEEFDRHHRFEPHPPVQARRGRGGGGGEAGGRGRGPRALTLIPKP